jgi:DNA-directed RNA polymerase specialized sigma24 family protein
MPPANFQESLAAWARGDADARERMQSRFRVIGDGIFFGSHREPIYVPEPWRVAAAHDVEAAMFSEFAGHPGALAVRGDQSVFEGEVKHRLRGRIWERLFGEWCQGNSDARQIMKAIFQSIALHYYRIRQIYDPATHEQCVEETADRTEEELQPRAANGEIRSDSYDDFIKTYVLRPLRTNFYDCIRAGKRQGGVPPSATVSLSPTDPDSDDSAIDPADSRATPHEAVYRENEGLAKQELDRMELARFFGDLYRRVEDARKRLPSLLNAMGAGDRPSLFIAFDVVLLYLKWRVAEHVPRCTAKGDPCARMQAPYLTWLDLPENTMENLIGEADLDALGSQLIKVAPKGSQGVRFQFRHDDLTTWVTRQERIKNTQGAPISRDNWYQMTLRLREFASEAAQTLATGPAGIDAREFKSLVDKLEEYALVGRAQA